MTNVTTFLEKIKPFLVSNDPLVQETVLHALHDFPKVPEEWTIELLKEAFKNNEKQTSILIYVDNQTINEEAVKILIKNIPFMDQSKIHLALNLLDNISPELALKYKDSLEPYIRKDMWLLYELLKNGTEKEVFTEYGKLLNNLEQADSHPHDLYIKIKKLAACLVQNGWITDDEIDMNMKKELNKQWFSYNGILSIYIIGLLKLEKYIPILSNLLVRDDDILLEEVAEALIHFQSDAVVKEVEPYLKRSDSIIYAASVVENIKSNLAVQVLREAYHVAEEIEDKDIIIEALCHHLSKEALPEISDHMKKQYFSSLIEMEQTVYSYYSILGEHHPELEDWRHTALEREMHFRDAKKQGNLLQSIPIVVENKVGRNDPCPCGSGKKYKKCCGK